MKFVLEIAFDESDQATAITEIGRALRYWAGNLKHYDLAKPVTEQITDSAYEPIGSWSILP